MLLVVAVRQVQENGATLKEANGRPVRVRVRQRRNAAIWVDLKEPGFLLFLLGEVDSRDLVLQAKLLEKQRDFDAIGRLRRVEVNVGGGRHGVVQGVWIWYAEKLSVLLSFNLCGSAVVYCSPQGVS